MISPEVFYLHIQGEQRGPYTIPQIDHLLHSGLIAEETLYWREGLEQWQPVTSLVRLRRKGSPWIKRGLIAGAGVIFALALYFFGSIAFVGWQEANQHEYTERAAYWRSRDLVRSAAVPAGALVQFGDYPRARVTLAPPRAAEVILAGELTSLSGEVRQVSWRIPMKYNDQAHEWSGGPVQQISP